MTSGRLFLSSSSEFSAILVEQAADALRSYCEEIKPALLKNEHLYSIGFTGAQDLPRLSVSYVGSAPIDVNFVFDNQPKPRIFVADMDSTMIGQECIDELADYAGVKAEVARITESAMKGELDFEEALRARVHLLEGLPETVLEECYLDRIKPNPGALELVSGLKEHGIKTALVSGGFTFFASRIAEKLGFDLFEANVLELCDGHLTGQVLGRIVDKSRKAEVLRELAAKSGHDLSATIAIGDGSNDLAMLQLAGYKVAYHAKPILADHANIRLQHTSLELLLPILGF